jgi:hypothetical protein
MTREPRSAIRTADPAVAERIRAIIADTPRRGAHAVPSRGRSA